MSCRAVSSCPVLSSGQRVCLVEQRTSMYQSMRVGNVHLAVHHSWGCLAWSIAAFCLAFARAPDSFRTKLSICHPRKQLYARVIPSLTSYSRTSFCQQVWKGQPPTPHTPLPRASAQLCNGSGEFGGVCMSGLVSIRRLYCSTGRLVEATLQTCIVLTSPLLGSVRVQRSLCLFLSLPVRPGSRLLCPIDTMH